jgi:hypothetical protein
MLFKYDTISICLIQSNDCTVWDSKSHLTTMICNVCQNFFFSADYETSCSTDGKYIACASRKEAGSMLLSYKVKSNIKVSEYQLVFCIRGTEWIKYASIPVPYCDLRSSYL